jgi:hypothetical protein
MSMKRKLTFDPKCYELAEAFLEDETGMGSEADLNDLATEIQNTIENWIEHARSLNEPRQNIPGET